MFGYFWGFDGNRFDVWKDPSEEALSGGRGMYVNPVILTLFSFVGFYTFQRYTQNSPPYLEMNQLLKLCCCCCDYFVGMLLKVLHCAPCGCLVQISFRYGTLSHCYFYPTYLQIGFLFIFSYFLSLLLLIVVLLMFNGFLGL